MKLFFPDASHQKSMPNLLAGNLGRGGVTTPMVSSYHSTTNSKNLRAKSPRTAEVVGDAGPTQRYPLAGSSSSHSVRRFFFGVFGLLQELLLQYT